MRYIDPDGREVVIRPGHKKTFYQKVDDWLTRFCYRNFIAGGAYRADGLGDKLIPTMDGRMITLSSSGEKYFSNREKDTDRAFFLVTLFCSEFTFVKKCTLNVNVSFKLTKKEINRLRNSAVNTAWKQEKMMIENGFEGTRKWTDAEIKELLTYGKVKGYEGHHINSVQWCIDNNRIDLIGNPDNIKFMRKMEHLYNGHNGNWRNYSTGELLNRSIY